MSIQLYFSSLMGDKFFGGTKITELELAAWTSNFARSAKLNTLNEQIFTESQN